MAASPMNKIEPGIKVAAQMSPEPSEEDFQFVRQMGVEYAVLWTDGAHANYDYFAPIGTSWGVAGAMVSMVCLAGINRKYLWKVAVVVVVVTWLVTYAAVGWHMLDLPFRIAYPIALLELRAQPAATATGVCGFPWARERAAENNESPRKLSRRLKRSP